MIIIIIINVYGNRLQRLWNETKEQKNNIHRNSKNLYRFSFKACAMQSAWQLEEEDLNATHFEFLMSFGTENTKNNWKLFHNPDIKWVQNGKWFT